MTKPFFTISLDFELFWGVYDTETIASYGKNILGGREAIPIVLSLFQKYNIHATWATVGMASFENKKELMDYLPEIEPIYKGARVGPYEHLKIVGRNEREDPYHFGYSLLQKIIDTEGMEVGCHSFSHLYCLEMDNTLAFKADLQSANRAFKRLDIEPKSLIFCRNQYQLSDLKVAKELGYHTYRGNENHFIYKPRQRNSLPIRALRLIDSYANIGGHHESRPILDHSKLVNIPASRFLRPVSKIRYLESSRLDRIKHSMRYAAGKGLGFHLWWHPHNFGTKLQDNIIFLKSILEYYEILKEEYGVESLTMDEVSRKIFPR